MYIGLLLVKLGQTYQMYMFFKCIYRPVDTLGIVLRLRINVCRRISTRTPLHSEHAVEQVVPCFRHEHRWVVQSDVQLQRITSKNFWGACCRSVMIGSNFPELTFQLQSTGGISTPSHSWIWWYTLRLWHFTDSEVGGSVAGWTGAELVATFTHAEFLIS